jgi:hypothetical protein
LQGPDSWARLPPGAKKPAYNNQLLQEYSMLTLTSLTSLLPAGLPGIPARAFAAAALALALPLFASHATAAHHEEALPPYAERATAIEIDAKVISVDVETRELVVELPTG